MAEGTCPHSVQDSIRYSESCPAGTVCMSKIWLADDTLMSQNRDNTRWSRKEELPCTLYPVQGAMRADCRTFYFTSPR